MKPFSDPSADSQDFDFDEVFDQVMDEVFGPEYETTAYSNPTPVDPGLQQDPEFMSLMAYFEKTSQDKSAPEFDERVYEIFKRVMLRILNTPSLN